MVEFLTIKEASEWASDLLKRDVTTANISYLLQYGKVRRHKKNGTIFVSVKDLTLYYKEYKQRKTDWAVKLGTDLNWALSFENYKEADTTKHTHKLHPYKGKYIPQLVEYFIDNHTDSFKKESYFKKGDIILDPFSGSGTTMVQANESGLHAIGVDISAFNSLIANVKVGKVDFGDLKRELRQITSALKIFIEGQNNTQFETELNKELNIFNGQYFPSPEYTIKIQNGEIEEKEYAHHKEKDFLNIFKGLQQKHSIVWHDQESDKSFLGKWLIKPVRDEIHFTFELLKKVSDPDTKKILTIILSRTIRSCRATTHNDLATLKEPVTKAYYCRKHNKICKPLFSILSWWERYSKDTLKRLLEFEDLRTNTYQICLQGDARNIDIISELYNINSIYARLVWKKKIRGIFSSPPYVGLIDYHEQHAYAYDLFGYKRKDALEIGPLYRGQGKEARDSYIDGISHVLNNSKQYLQEDYDIFLVANDKYNMYPTIVKKSGMKIINQFKRPVMNRTEKDRSAYAEIIFHIKKI